MSVSSLCAVARCPILVAWRGGQRNIFFLLDAKAALVQRKFMEKKAPEMLKKWLEQEGRKASWLAAQVQADRSTVSQWINGHRVPRPTARMRLAAITGLVIDGGDLWK